jgi:hypothetical protein
MGDTGFHVPGTRGFCMNHELAGPAWPDLLTFTANLTSFNQLHAMQQSDLFQTANQCC